MTDLQSLLAALSDQLTVHDAPLLAYEHRALQHGNRISHLPVEPRLVEAWLRVTSSPFFHPHAVALSSLRRGEHFALFGPSGVTDDCLHLMALERLAALPESTVLLLVPDEAAVNHHLRSLRLLSRAMEPGPPVAALSSVADRTVARARLLVMTPRDLDQRLLQHHCRMLQSYIQRLDLVLISDYQRLNGVAALHLQHLLQRVERISGHPDLQYGVAAVTLPLPGDALQRLAPGNWRNIAIDEGPRSARAVAVWQLQTDRLHDLVRLAQALAAQVDSVHLVAHVSEVELLRARLAPNPSVTVGTEVCNARVLVLTSADLGARRWAEALARDAELTLLCVGTSAAEQVVAQAVQLPREHQWFGVRPAWFSPAANSYITARHLLCTAAEQPLTADEAAAWQLEDYVTQLTARGALQQIPAAGPAWVPARDCEPYADFDLDVPAGPPLRIGQRSAGLLSADPAGFDRWYHADAALPPLRGGLRVTRRDEQTLAVQLSPAEADFRSLPLRRCRVTVREQRHERSLAPLHRLRIGVGRVLVNEEIVGTVSGSAAAARRIPFHDPPTLTWMSAAAWIELPLQRAVADQQIGWSLAAALPLFSCAALTDLVPLYDETSHRLYLVDAQPAGSGLADWLYTGLESLLPTAFEIALQWQQDAVLQETAAADVEWLTALLGRTAETTVAMQRERVPLAVQALRDPAGLRQLPATLEPRPDPAPPPARNRPAAPPTTDYHNESPPRRSALLPAGLVPPPRRRATDEASATPADVGRAAASPLPSRKPPAQLEFHIGDRVSCSPYGNGVVRSITLNGSRRLISVDFGQYGALPIDPALSPLRLVARSDRKRR